MSEVAVETRAVQRWYVMGEATVRAVDGVSLRIDVGEFVALLGSSGSGKSSLLNLIAGLDHATAGEIVVHGRDLAKMSREDLARYRRNDVGVVFQAFHLCAWRTVAQNVHLPLGFTEVAKSEREARVREALERVGLCHRTDHRPAEISGGEQQRTAIWAKIDLGEPGKFPVLAWASGATVLVAATLLISIVPTVPPRVTADSDHELMVQLERTLQSEVPVALEPASLLAREIRQNSQLNSSSPDRKKESSHEN